ncbi:MAG: acyl-CoA dehydrogenase [Alphaproteobacteria bacterium]|nr:acyl-CoA dehydrogenase [Alphaproteobacteria bacterium]
MIPTPEQTAFRDRVRALAAAELLPHAAAADRAGVLPVDTLRRLGRDGLMAVYMPTRWGGLGLDQLSLALAVEELAAGDASVAVVTSLNNSLVCGPLLKFGTDEQRTRHLEPVARGRIFGCFALAEPAAGSDAARLTMTARAEGDHYVLEGTKWLITGGSHAELCLVFALTNPAAGAKGMSCFIVPTVTPGYRVAEVDRKLGIRASGTARIEFTNCRVPAAAMLGKPGEGYRIALDGLGTSRLGIAAQAIGIARAAYEAARDYARKREAFGSTLIGHQAIAFKLADMATEIEAARALTHHAAALRDADLPNQKEVAMAKLFASEMVERVCSEAVQIHGGIGVLEGTLVERLYRDQRVCQIYEGTSEVQRIIIGRLIAAE